MSLILFTLLALLICLLVLALLCCLPLRKRLGLARDWRVVASRQYSMTETTWIGNIFISNPVVKHVTHTLALERCSLTGRERARLIRPPESLYSTISYDLSLARIELGVSDKAPSP